jgi:predicted RNA-binding protein
MLSETQAWICVVNCENFEIIRKKKVYGVPDRSNVIKKLANVNENDILLFYVITPIQRICGKSKALSSMFQKTSKSPWKDRLYPYRIKIAEMEELSIPVRNFITKISSVKAGRIPMGASLIRLNKEDYETIMAVSKDTGNS